MPPDPPERLLRSTFSFSFRAYTFQIAHFVSGKIS